MASITLEARQALISLYVGMFQAAPGAANLSAMVLAWESGKTMKEIAEDLDNADFRSIYPAFLTAEEFADKLVANLLGDDVGAGATSWATNWVKAKLNAGVSDTDVIVQAVNALRATDNTNYDTAQATLSNKVEVAAYYSIEKGQSSDSLAELQSVIAGVDSTEASVTNAKDELDDNAPGSGLSFTLTKELDTVTGGAGDDIVSAVITDATTGNTWDIADTIDLGAGTGDTINARIITDANTTFSGYVTKNAEIINLTSVDASTTGHTSTVSIAGIAGETAVWAKNGTVSGTNDDTLEITGITDGVKLGVADNDSDLDVKFTTDGVAAAADSVTLATQGATGDVTINDGAGDGYATVNVEVGGDTTLSSLSGGTDFATLNITGDSKLSISTALNASVKTIDASKATGAVTLSATASSSLKATGGTGTSDKLTLSMGSSIATGMAVSAFETVALSASATSTLDLDLITGATALQIDSNGATANVLTLDDADAGFTANFVGTGLSSGDLTFNGATVILDDPSGTSDTVGFSIGNAGKASTGKGSTGLLTAANIETVTLATADFKTVATTIDFANAKTVTITGSSALDLDDTAVNIPVAETVDASNYTGDITLGALDNVGVTSTVTTGSGKDTLTNAALNVASKTQTIKTQAGNDTVTVVDVTQATATTSIDLGEGDDTVQFTAAADANTGILKIAGGAGEDTLKLGAALNAKTIDIDEFSGFEKIVLEGVTGGSTLNLGVTASYSETVGVTDVSGLTETIDVQAETAGVTVSLANWTFLGWTSGTDILKLTGSTGNETLTGSSVIDTIEGKAGDDTVKGGTGIDIFIYDAATDGVDTYSDFDWGAGGDTLQLTATAGIADAAGNAAAVTSGVDGGAVAVAALAVDTAIGAAATQELFVIAAGADNTAVALTSTATDIETAIAAQLEDGTSVAGNLAAGEGFYGLIANDADNNGTADSYFLFEYKEQGTAGQAEAGDVNVIGIFNGTDAANAAAGNFV